jgi:putative ABC transport system permease protein
VFSDFAYGIRRIVRDPVFAGLAIVTLALGIGANTAIYSVVRSAVFRPLPYGHPDRLVMLWGKVTRGATTHLSAPELSDYSAEARTFSHVAAYATEAAILTGGVEPERVVAAAVTPNIFETLGVPAMLGRTFVPSDNPRDIADQIVLSDSLWQRRFGGNRDVVGSQILVDGAQALVVGVMPPTFKLPLDFNDDRPSELWRPLDSQAAEWRGWGNHSFIGVARLRDGVSPVGATAAMRKLEDRWIQDHVGGGWNDRDVQRRAAVPLSDLVVGDSRYAFLTLLGAVGVILIIACANVANLALAKSDDRRREIAVRTAIGASRARIVRQLLAESVTISACGGAVGLAIASLAMRTLIAIRPAGIPRIDQAGLDANVLVFTIVISVAAGVVFGLAPATELSRADLNRPLKDGGWSGTTGRASQRFRDSLVVTQMAFSVVLLVGALLLIRSLAGLQRIDLGFVPAGALTVRVTLPPNAYARDVDAIRAIRVLRQRLGDLPGVQAVGATRLLPQTGTIGNWSITQEGRPKQPGENPNGDWQVVTPGYFESMGIRLVRGRSFADTDDEHAPIVAVISETMAARYWPGEDPIGNRFRVGGPAVPWITVVGLVGHVRHNTLTELPRAEMYVPHAQWGAAGASTRLAMTFVIRTNGDPVAALPFVREAVHAIDSNLPLSEVRTLDRVTGAALSQARFTTGLLGLFAVLAVALAAVGIYGLISLLMKRRRREMGIRMALGARWTEIVQMVLMRGMALAAVGVAAGLASAAAMTRLVANLLYGVTPLDPVTFASVPCVLFGVALLACLIPAVRAARLDPVAALRHD